MSVRVTDPKRAESQINQRLSLRKPQSESLRRLADIVDLIAPSKETDIGAAREAIRAAYGNLNDAYFDDFERDFLVRLLARAEGNLAKAAALAAIERHYLRSLLKKHGLRE